VTGYDLHKLVVGSLGTLAVIVQVALKLRPLPEAALTASFFTDGDGLELANTLLRAVPNAAGVIAAADRVEVRYEGWADEVRDMTEAGAAIAPNDVLDAQAFPDAPAWSGESEIVVEAAVPPSRIGELVDGLDGWQALVGVGIVWFRLGALPETTVQADALEEQIAEIRARARGLGGIAPVMRGPGGLGDDPVPALEVHQRLKASFDPNGVLAPGRFWGGI
jgi:glycolate oxidase FAD binding subunit